MEGWADLPADLFSLIPFWDGRMVAYVRSTCTKWKRAIERYEHAMSMFALHYVRVEYIAELDGELCKRGKLKEVAQTTAANLMDGILWTQHQFNGYMIGDVFHRASTHISAMTSKIIAPDAFVRTFGWGGEGLGYMVDTTTHDVVLVNNCYGMFHKWNDTAWVSGMQFLQDTFKGDVTWKLIDFPFQANQRYAVAKHEFHRGGCYMVRFKNAQRVAYKGTGKHLRSEAKRKRRRDLHPIERVVREFVQSNGRDKYKHWL